MAKEWDGSAARRWAPGRRKGSHYRDKGDRRNRTWFKKPISKLWLRLKKFPTNLVIPGGEGGGLPTRKIDGRVLQKAPGCSWYKKWENEGEGEDEGMERELAIFVHLSVHKPRFNFATRESHSPLLCIFPWAPLPCPSRNAMKPDSRDVWNANDIRDRKVPTRALWIKRIVES